MRYALDAPDLEGLNEEPVTAAAAGEAPGGRIGRYRLGERIGEGGCGVVYVAEQEEPVRRTVALKVIKLGMDTEQVIARFAGERQALALMDHPNIAKVLDAGATETGRPYFVMELVRGLSITSFCDRHALSTRARLELFIKVCHAVQHAHQKGIIHRDLKASNILVQEGDPGEPRVPKVIDFGIAKATGGRLSDLTLHTDFRQFLGTPAYMSPEQAANSHDIDTRTDIYSLGVLLYELLAGKPPFDTKELLAAGPDEMRRTIQEKEPVKPSTRLTQELSAVAASRQSAADSPARDGGALPRRRYEQLQALIRLLRGDLDWIVMKCLEKDRERRYATANDLALDLQRHLNNEPVTARPPSSLYRFQKLVRRNQVTFAAGSAVVAALVVGLGLSACFYFRERQARRQAVAATFEGKRTLSAADLSQAVLLTAEDRANEALAYLARSLSSDPSNVAALTRLTTLLAYRSWMLPTAILRHTNLVASARFSPEGKRVVTASWDDTARVWDAETGRPWTGPLSHSGFVVSARFSPDGQRILTASYDKTAGLWDANDSRLLRCLTNHADWVTTAQFSPDGGQIVTGSRDRSARVWDAQTGEPLTPPMNHSNGLRSAQFSPDGKWVLTGCSDGGTRIWNALTGGLVAGPMKHFRDVQQAVFSPDGGLIATASYDCTARVWDAQNGEPITQPLRHGGWVMSARFSPDGERVVTASADGTARVWDAWTGRALAGPLKHGDGVMSAEFSPDGRRILTGSWDNTARLWDAQTGEPLCEPMEHDGKVWSAEFSPDGKRIVTASADFTARLWRPLGARALPMPLEQSSPERRLQPALSVQTLPAPLERNVSSPSAGNQPAPQPAAAELLSTGGNLEAIAEVSPDGTRILAALGGNAARAWDAQTGRLLPLSLQHDGEVVSVQFSPDGKLIATASADHTARIWDAQTGQPVARPLPHGGSVFSAKFSPDGARLVTASADGTARLWNVRAGQPLAQPLEHGGPPCSAGFSPDGNRVVTVSSNGIVRLWDAHSGQPLAPAVTYKGPVVSAQFSPDGRRVVVAASDKGADVLDARSGQPAAPRLQHGDRVNAAHFSPDGKRIVTASWDRTARVWDAASGRPLTGPLRHADQVVSAQFSPDGKLVATASLDKTARVWDAETGQPLTEPLQHPAGLVAALFSPDGTRLLTVSTNGAWVWDLAPAPAKPPDWLLPLAEAVSGRVLAGRNVLEETKLDRAGTVKAIQQRLAREPAGDPWATWGRWFLADPSERTISPFSKMTLPEYFNRLLEAPTDEALLEVEQLAAGNPPLLRRIAAAQRRMEPPEPPESQKREMLKNLVTPSRNSR